MSDDQQLIVYSKLAVLDLSFIPFLILKTVAISIISTLIAWLSIKVMWSKNFMHTLNNDIVMITVKDA